MTLKLIVSEGDVKIGKCIYSDSDFTIEYKFDTKINTLNQNRVFMLIYDTLTISFDSKNKEFISFDAYTNVKNWNYKNEIKLPKVYKSGLLKTQEGFEDTDRYSFKFTPIYEYSTVGFLKITLCDDQQLTFYYEISKDLIIGIKDYKLTSLFVSNIYFM